MKNFLLPLLVLFCGCQKVHNSDYQDFVGSNISELRRTLHSEGEKAEAFYYGAIPEYAKLDSKTGIPKTSTHFVDFTGIHNESDVSLDVLRAEVNSETGEILSIFFIK